VQSAEPGDSGLSSIRVVHDAILLSATTVRQLPLFGVRGAVTALVFGDTAPHAGCPRGDPHDAVVSIETQVRQVARAKAVTGPARQGAARFKVKITVFHLH